LTPQLGEVEEKEREGLKRKGEDVSSVAAAAPEGDSA